MAQKAGEKKFQAWLLESDIERLEKAIQGKYETKRAWLEAMIELTVNGASEPKRKTVKKQIEKEPIKKTLLQEARLKRGLNKAQVAKEIGIDRSAYHHIESGKRRGRYETLLKLAEFFNLTIEDILLEFSEKN